MIQQELKNKKLDYFKKVQLIQKHIHFESKVILIQDRNQLKKEAGEINEKINNFMKASLMKKISSAHYKAGMSEFANVSNV